MRVCHVITRLIIGGAQENTLLTCQGLAQRGHDVTLVAGPETGPEGSLWDRAESGCGRVIRARWLRRNVHPVADPLALRELTRILRTLRCEVVHTHSSKGGILGRWAARRAGVPVIVHTIHGMSFNRTQPGLVYRFYRGLERWAARYTDAFVSVADAMTAQAVRAGLAPPERFVTIYSGMRTDQFASDALARREWRARWGMANDAFVVGTIARLFPNKGYEELLKALPIIAKALPTARFVWVGNGSAKPKFQQHLIRAGLRDRVVFTGLLAPDAIPAVIAGFDVLVHLSFWEGLPRVAVQALLTEVPVISTFLDGAPEVVIPGQTGLLVEPGDTSGLVAHLARLAGSPELRRELGRQGRRLCLERFDYRRMVEELERLYERLLASRATRAVRAT